MFVFRVVRAEDVDPLMALATEGGGGLTTFKPDRAALQARVDVALRSFAGELEMGQADYVFALEDTTQAKVVGVSALKACVGLSAPFYNFRVGRLVHSSRELGIYANKSTLYLTNDLTGCAELCTLFLDPAYRQGQLGRLLSKARMLFMAGHMALLPEMVIAELRGFQSAHGSSPFWDSLGRHFFRMDFDQADDLSGLGQKSFIAELMPRFPVYTDFLTDEARQAIAMVHTSTEPAKRLLEQEGFSYRGYVDIFDAGPVLQAQTKDLRIVRESGLAIAALALEAGEPKTRPPLLVANTSCVDFRAIVAQASVQFGRLSLAAHELQVLGLKAGDPVRYVTLNPEVRQPCIT